MNRQTESTSELSMFGRPLAQSSLTGVLLAVNAIPDLYILMDCSDCATLRAQLIYGVHDWNSTLLSQKGEHRVVNTGLWPDRIALDRRDELVQLAQKILNRQSCSLLLVYAAPTAAMVAIDYVALLAHLPEELKARVKVMPMISCVSHFVDGYISVMEFLAQTLPLPQPDKKRGGDKSKVAIVGYLWDRNEGDHRGNVKELRRLLSKLGLELSAVWFSGTNIDSLKKIAEADWIISFPHGGKAAQILSQRLGIPMIESCLPIGLNRTVNWISTVAQATNREAEAQRLVKQEMKYWIPQLTKPAIAFIASTAFAVCTEAQLAAGLCDMLSEFGAEVILAAYAGSTDAQESQQSDWPALVDPVLHELKQRVETAKAQVLGPCLLIGNSQALEVFGPTADPTLCLGFQSAQQHFLFDSPYLGFAGVASLTDRIVQALVQNQTRDRPTKPW